MESNIGMGFEEMKILYDIEPLNMTNDCKESISDNGWVTFAICSHESIILSGIREYLQNQLQKRQLLVWSRADEIVFKGKIYSHLLHRKSATWFFALFNAGDSFCSK